MNALMCYFPNVVINNYHKLCGLKQHKLIILQFWRLEVLNYFVRDAFLLETQGQNPFPSQCSSASRSFKHFLAHCITSLLSHPSLWLSPSCLSLIEDLCGYIGSTQIIQDNFLSLSPLSWSHLHSPFAT